MAQPTRAQAENALYQALHPTIPTVLDLMPKAPKESYDISVAATIFNEARGESKAGRQAVVAVIRNRTKYSCSKCSNNHGLGTWKSTNIFHGYAASKPNVPKAEECIWDECVEFAKQLQSGTLVDNTNGATHFQRGTFSSTDFESKGKIGAHNFA